MSATRIEPYNGDHRDLLWSFRLADDSESPETGYPDPIEVDGIPLRGQVWSSRVP